MPTQKHPLNTVLLVGRVCKPPAMSSSRSGKPMLTVVLSVDRPDNMPQKMVSEAGHVRIEPDYPVVVITGDIARELAGKVQIGTNLFVSGIFQTRNYTDNSVQPPRLRVAQEVLTNDVRALETPADMARAQNTIVQAQTATEELVAPRESAGSTTPRSAANDPARVTRQARNARKRQRKQRAREHAAASATPTASVTPTPNSTPLLSAGSTTSTSAGVSQ